MKLKFKILVIFFIFGSSFAQFRAGYNSKEQYTPGRCSFAFMYGFNYGCKGLFLGSPSTFALGLFSDTRNYDEGFAMAHAMLSLSGGAAGVPIGFIRSFFVPLPEVIGFKDYLYCLPEGKLGIKHGVMLGIEARKSGMNFGIMLRDYTAKSYWPDYLSLDYQELKLRKFNDSSGYRTDKAAFEFKTSLTMRNYTQNKYFLNFFYGWTLGYQEGDYLEKASDIDSKEEESKRADFHSPYFNIHAGLNFNFFNSFELETTFLLEPIGYYWFLDHDLYRNSIFTFEISISTYF